MTNIVNPWGGEAVAEADQVQAEYIQEVVTASMAAEGLTPASPGYHNSRFVAERAIRQVLQDAVNDQEYNNGSGEQ